MGIHFIDEYTISHIIGGIILQRMRFSFLTANILHFVYEIFENHIYIPYFGKRCINLKPLLPIEDCKTKSDTNINLLSDQLFFILGYLISSNISLKTIPYLSNIYILILPFLSLILSLLTTNIIGYLPKYT